MITKILAIAIMAISCTSKPVEDKPVGGTVQLSQTEITLDFEEQETYITVTADSDWGSSVSAPEWCSVYPTGGVKGETKVKISVKKNLLTEDRTNTITFRTSSSTTPLTLLQQTSSTGEAMFVPEGYKLFWSDEFDGPSLNTENWTCEIGGHGWGNAELQYYTDRQENVDVRDGKLVITARKENYQGSKATSARLITLGKVYFKYGYVTASIKLPKTANGLWPAFWMTSNPRAGQTAVRQTSLKWATRTDSTTVRKPSSTVPAIGELQVISIMPVISTTNTLFRTETSIHSHVSGQKIRYQCISILKSTLMQSHISRWLSRTSATMSSVRIISFF